MHFYGGLTPRTHQMLLNEGFTPSQLTNYKSVTPKKAP